MNIEVFVADEQVDHPIDTDRWLRLAVQVLAAEGVDRNNEGVEMSLLFVDEPSIAELNVQFMGKTGPTDVLSFPIDEGDCTFWRFPLWISPPTDLAALRRRLLARGVDTSPTNLECCSREAAFAGCAADTPEARRFVDAMIFLPMHPSLTEADVHRVAREVIAAVAR